MAAREAGTFFAYRQIPGFSSPFVDRESGVLSLEPELARRPIVLLGSVKGGATHAIALRGGRIVDSEYCGEGGGTELTRENLHRSLSEVYGAYVFAVNRAEDEETARLLSRKNFSVSASV